MHPYNVGEMRRLLEGKGIAVVESYGSTPDHDFVYLSKAKLLVLSGGGFSKRAAQVNKQPLFAELTAGADVLEMGDIVPEDGITF